MSKGPTGLLRQKLYTPFSLAVYFVAAAAFLDKTPSESQQFNAYIKKNSTRKANANV